MSFGLPRVSAYVISITVFLAVLFMPGRYTLGGPDHLWVNGVFELACVTVIFPALILIGVGAGTAPASRAAKVWEFLAELSYPLYMSHYPFCCVLRYWAKTSSASCSTACLIAVQAVFYVALLALAYAVMRWWDRPVQNFLNRAATGARE